jgi:hypothetical protein
MGVDLRSLDGELHLGWPAWGYCFDVGRAFGWQPEGTQKVEPVCVHCYIASKIDRPDMLMRWLRAYSLRLVDERTGQTPAHLAYMVESLFREIDDAGQPAEWGGGYFSNDYQQVTATDAKAWAAALERAIAAVQTESVLNVEQMKALTGGEENASPIPGAAIAQHFPGATITTPSFAYDVEPLRRLADYARQGGFSIG